MPFKNLANQKFISKKENNDDLVKNNKSSFSIN